jgi:hypothetical protein
VGAVVDEEEVHGHPAHQVSLAAVATAGVCRKAGSAAGGAGEALEGCQLTELARGTGEETLAAAKVVGNSVEGAAGLTDQVAGARRAGLGTHRALLSNGIPVLPQIAFWTAGIVPQLKVILRAVSQGRANCAGIQPSCKTALAPQSALDALPEASIVVVVVRA